MQLIRHRLVLFPIVLILLMTACAQEDPGPDLPPVVPTIDTASISAEVLAEVEDLLAEQDQARTAEFEEASEALAERVRSQVQEQLAQEEEQVPVNFASEGMAAAGADLEASLIDLYRRTNPSVVFILVPPIGSGSGFVLSEEGYIVTNNHVVEGGSEYEVVFASGERRRAELIGADVDSDLAVIQVDDLPDGVRPLPLGSSSEIAVGQFVVAIGNPFGEQGSMSLGIVSGLDRSLSSQREIATGSSYSLPQVIQTDAPINPGNSGGPLLNLNGEVVGVNSAIISASGTNSGVGFSIPVDAVKRIAPSLIESGAYDYPFMGAAFASELSLDDQELLGLPQLLGAYVLNVTAGGPADQAGLIAADLSTGQGGDLVVAIDGRPIRDFSDLNGYLVFETVAGQTIDITVLRGGEEVSVPLTLGTRP